MSISSLFKKVLERYHIKVKPQPKERKGEEREKGSGRENTEMKKKLFNFDFGVILTFESRVLLFQSSFPLGKNKMKAKEFPGEEGEREIV